MSRKLVQSLYMSLPSHLSSVAIQKGQKRTLAHSSLVRLVLFLSLFTLGKMPNQHFAFQMIVFFEHSSIYFQ